MRTHTDYSNSTFYKIYCKTNYSLSYVGNTAIKLQTRICGHKSLCRRNGTCKLYKAILANGGWGNFIFETIEVVNLANRLEAINREQYWCDILHPSLNSNSPSVVSFDGKVFYTQPTNEDEVVKTLSKNNFNLNSFNLEDKNNYLFVYKMTTEFKETLAKTIKNNRPKLSDKSVSAYISTLYNIPKKLGVDMKDMDIDWYKQNADKIVKLMDDKPATSRKSVLSALFILTGLEDIHDKMIVDAKSVNELYKKQKMSVSQEENWMDWAQILQKYNVMKLQAGLLFKKKTLSPDEFGELNKFMLLSCFVLFPPRRILDFAVMKIRNYTKETDNFIEKGSWNFNVYKTVKVYGKQTFPITKEFQQLIKKWMKINETDYLIVNTYKRPYTSSGIGKTLNSVFGKNISCDILRHSFLTHTYSGKMPSLVEMEDIAKKLAHSVNQSMLYIKRE